MSVMDGNDNDEMGSFQTTPVEPYEGGEVDEEQFQRAPVMPMMDGSDRDEIGPFQATSIEPGDGNET